MARIFWIIVMHGFMVFDGQELAEHLTKATGISASEKEDAHQNQHI
jgi:hypothetical protein